MNKTLKKILPLILILTMLLSGCSAAEVLPPIPTREPEATPAPTEEPTPEVTPEAEVTPEPTPEPTPVPVSPDDARVSVSFPETIEKYYAPDVSDLNIVSFSYLTPTVRIEGNDKASERINDIVALQNDFFYTGTDRYLGIARVYEMALDAYSYAKEKDENANFSFFSNRSAAVGRCDSCAISFKYTVSSYTGASEEEYYLEGQTFDTQSGKQLALTDVISDTGAFAEIAQKCAKDWQKENGVKLKKTEVTEELLASCEWYLSENGIVIVLDSDEVREAVYSPVELTVPYEELNGLLSENYSKRVKETDGTIAVSSVDPNEENKVEILDRVVCCDGGQEYLLSVENGVADVTLYRVTYSGDSFYITDTVWYCSYMQDCAVQISTIIPEGAPNLMISYKTAEGETEEVLLTESGEDGSIILMDDFQAVG